MRKESIKTILESVRYNDEASVIPSLLVLILEELESINKKLNETYSTSTPKVD